MTRLINHFLMLLLIFATAAALASGQDVRVISRIEFSGLEQVTPDQALATSGLKVEQRFRVQDVDAAAQRLLDSGLFKKLGYSTRTVGNKIIITFQVEEAKGGDVPVVFDNFIWFTDEQLTDAVKRQVPSFAGRAPTVGKMAADIKRALQQLIDEQKIPVTVEYLGSSDLSGQMLGYVFSVSGIKMPICTLHFPAARAIPQTKLASVTKEEVTDTDYSRELIGGFAGMKLVGMYREIGKLRVKFAAPAAKPDPSCKNGVDVTIPVEEGLTYTLRQLDWSGANALTADELNKAVALRAGEIADGLRFDKGLMQVTKAYGRQGYLNARVQATPEFDDSAQTVSYKIDVMEGQQFHMGGLSFKGFSERDAKALRSAFRLKRGEVFDEGYLHTDFGKDMGMALRSLFEERQAVGKPLPQVQPTLTPNKETLTVEVVLELGN